MQLEYLNNLHRHKCLYVNNELFVLALVWYAKYTVKSTVISVQKIHCLPEIQQCSMSHTDDLLVVFNLRGYHCGLENLPQVMERRMCSVVLSQVDDVDCL